MMGLAGVDAIPLVRVLGVVWMLGPTFFVGHALFGLLRRYRLRSRAVATDAEVTAVDVFSDVDGVEEGMLVELTVRYVVEGRAYAHQVTRSDHNRAHYDVGSRLELVYERGQPCNVMDSASRPWNDVIGPVVFSSLLFVFMGWLWVFLSGLV